MKKLTSLLLIACLALSVLGIASVSAANDEVLKGTPTVDGKVDEIYKQSLTIVYDGDPDKNKSNQQWFVGSMTTYALYDENYVYVIADVKDDDVVSADKNWIMTNTNPYQNDTVEFRFTYKGTPGIQFKVGVDAFGYRAYTLQPTICDISKVIYKTAITDDGYVIEIAVPTAMLDKSSVIDAGKLGLKMWLFDLQAAAAGKASPKDNQDSVLYSAMYGTEEEAGNFGSPVFYTLSDEEAKVEAPKPADPTPSTPSAPATFDAGIAAAVAAVVSGAAVVFSKKRR